MNQKITFKTILLILPVILLPLTGKTGESKNFIASSFTTSIEEQDDNVKHNIMLACRNINGMLIPPGTIFSFNEIVGEGSARNGFVTGRVLYRDRVRMEPGGGLCQVSSTLFNTLLLAGCSIIERHRHYQPVTYVPPGLDATIKYGKKDLRMKNPHSCSLVVNAGMNDKSLMIIIKSGKKLKYRYEVFTEKEEVAVPLADENNSIRQGIAVYVYRRKFLGQKLIENFLIYKDYYPPVYEE